MLTCSTRSISSLRVTVVTSSGGILISLISTFALLWSLLIVSNTGRCFVQTVLLVGRERSLPITVLIILPYPSGILLHTGPKHTHVRY